MVSDIVSSLKITPVLDRKMAVDQRLGEFNRRTVMVLPLFVARISEYHAETMRCVYGEQRLSPPDSVAQ